MSFNYQEVKYSEIKTGPFKPVSENVMSVLRNVKFGERYMVEAWNRTFNQNGPEKRMWFNHAIIYDDDVVCTVSGDHANIFDYTEKALLSDKSISNASTFPQDYDFGTVRIPYVCGMSVPPVMMKRIVQRLIEQGVFRYKGVM